jgi:DNA-binding NtrC family response regulator
MARSVLVVTHDEVGCGAIVKALSGAGYQASGASTFEDARGSLTRHSPDLVIADERLGAYNGLHLILFGRAKRPEMAGIVTTSAKDDYLESVAKSLRAQYVVKPLDPTEWITLTARMLDSRSGAGQATTLSPVA